MQVDRNGPDKSYDVPAAHGEWLGIVRLANDVVNTAIADAEREIVDDPYSFGPASRFLMDHPTSCAERIQSSISIWCDVLGFETKTFMDWIADRLDAFAETMKTADNVSVIHDRIKASAQKPAVIHLNLFPVLLVHNAPERERTRRKTENKGSSQLALIAA